MKPNNIRDCLADIDNAIAMNHLLAARQKIAALSEEIFVSEDDEYESWAADLGDFGLAKEIDEVNEE